MLTKTARPASNWPAAAGGVSDGGAFDRDASDWDASDWDASSPGSSDRNAPRLPVVRAFVPAARPGYAECSDRGHA
jgi:hypothetical protein